MVRYALR